MKSLRAHLCLSLIFAPFTFSPLAAQAQPAGEEAPKTNNPPNAPFAGLGGMRPQEWQNLTPKARREAIRKSTLQTLRGSLVFLGFTDKAMLDAIEETTVQQEKILAPLRLQQRDLIAALMANALPATTINGLREEFQQEVARARVTHQKTVAALDKKINFSKNARLSAALAFAGVTSDDTAFLGGAGTAIWGTTANYLLGLNQTPEQIAEEKLEAQIGAEEVIEQLEAEIETPAPTDKAQ